ncbi:MAG: M3 family metallopeptidase [Candidatus Woesearchaeota archaeon]
MENPLVERRFHVLFDEIKPEHVVPAVDEILKDANRQLEELVNSVPEQRTFENTMLEYESLTARLDYVFNIIDHLKNVDNNAEIVAAFNAINPRITEFCSDLGRNTGLYSVIKEYAKTEEAAQLQGARKRFLEKTLDEFRRSGAELGDEDKRRVSEIDVELAELGSKFSQNLLESTNAYSLLISDENRLAGLPQRDKDLAQERAKKRGDEGWLFNLQAPAVIPVLQYADDRELRKEIYTAYNSRASSGKHDNCGLIVKMLQLRNEKARLLGYANFADLVLEDRMAKEENTAIRFLEEIKSKVQGHFERENQELDDFHKNLTGLDAKMEPWDVNYYAEKMKKERFDFDSEELRPYFSFDRVLEGLFGLVHDLYGVRIEPTEDIKPWKGDGVRTYDLLDEDGTHLGSFFTDYFPREEKCDGAWMHWLYQGVPKDGILESHLALNCGNITPPSGGKPALLSIRDVETVFHEFGHLMHQLLSTAELRSQSGPAVAWDFVELPSQIMENWVRDKTFVKTFAKHHETGETLPDDLLDKMKASENYRQGNRMMRQAGFALTDFQVHTRYAAGRDGDLLKYCRDYAQQFSSTELSENYSMITGFHHLFANPVGYACAYYSYHWAEALEADAFTRFKEEGLLSRKVGTEFRDKILAKGDSVDAAELYRDFMGRDLDPDAMLKRAGLL